MQSRASLQRGHKRQRQQQLVRRHHRLRRHGTHTRSRPQHLLPCLRRPSSICASARPSGWGPAIHRYRFEVLGEAFNLFNHQNITSVNTQAYCVTTSPSTSAPNTGVACPQVQSLPPTTSSQYLSRQPAVRNQQQLKQQYFADPTPDADCRTFLLLAISHRHKGPVQTMDRPFDITATLGR